MYEEAGGSVEVKLTRTYRLYKAVKPSHCSSNSTMTPHWSDLYTS